MKFRFSQHQKTSLLGLYLVPSILVTKSLAELVTHLTPLEAMYRRDLQDDSFQSEIHLWLLKWKKQEDYGSNVLPKSLALTLPHASSFFPNIGILLRILCTLPVTSCSSERSFSTLKRVKTDLRSTTSNDRLSALSLLYIHRDINISVPDIIEEFSRRHPRRMQLSNILANDSH